jgi:hypothetical protein
MEPAVEAVLEAIAARDWTRLRPLLHPYLRWGEGLRGRRNVLAYLEEVGQVAPPASVELRNGQIYRWHP